MAQMHSHTSAISTNAHNYMHELQITHKTGRRFIGARVIDSATTVNTVKQGLCSAYVSQITRRECIQPTRITHTSRSTCSHTHYLAKEAHIPIHFRRLHTALHSV